MRPWHERLRAARAPLHAALDRLAAEAGVATESGRLLRFVAPRAGRRSSYELRVFETGEVETRPGNLHDLFNALAWLAWPRTKARLNALHAAQIPRERGRRGRLRDLATIFDEGGALVACTDPVIERLVREHRWKELFWERRATLGDALRVEVLGHAVLEQAQRHWPGLTCKALFCAPGAALDAQAAAWLARLPADASPRLLAPFPVFGLPGWSGAGADPAFYDDARYFRPVKSVPGVGQAAAARPRAEESPGSAERDAG